MSAVQNIVLNDAQGTPVAHTFTPIGQDTKGVWWYEDQSASAPIGYNRISLELTRAPNPSVGSNANERVNRVKVGFHTPKLEVVGNSSTGITPPPTVSYIVRCNMEFILPDRSSLQDRKDIRKYMDFLCAETQLTNMIENLQSVY